MLTLTLAFALTAQVTPRRSLLPVPNIGPWQTIKGDFHMHTVFSDGVVWPETRVQEAWRDGLDAIAITDHDDYHPHKDTVSTDLSHGYRLAAPLANQLGIMLIPALEVTKGDLHVNALFAKDVNVTAGKDLLPSLRLMQAQGAFLFWNHPGWKGNQGWYPEIDTAHKEGLIHGVEVVNEDKLEPQTLAWLEEKKLTILANSDVHQLVEVRPGHHRSPVTLVFAHTRDLAGLREAFRARRTLAWRQDELWGGGELLTGLFHASVTPLVSRLPVHDGSVALRLKNTSAIPYDLVVTKAPEWIKTGNPWEDVARAGFHIAAEAESSVALAVTRTRPAGAQRVELEVELRNLHIPMGGNARTKLVFEIE